MGRSRHQLTIRVPIPSSVPASSVLETLQTHSPLIRHQALVTRFQRRPVALESIVDDSFFLSDGQKISQFDVYEKITFVPHVAAKEISFPVIFQNIRSGVRARADAPAGVRLWSEYRVQARENKPHGDSEDADGKWESASRYSGFSNSHELYELVEDVVVEANSVLMAFVYKSMEGAHRDLCQKVLNEVVEKQRETDPAQFGL